MSAAPERRVLAGVEPLVPCVPLPALGRFRLVHEAPDVSGAAAIPSVRVFEVTPR